MRPLQDERGEGGVITSFEMANLLHQLGSLQNRLPRLRMELNERMETRFDDEHWERGMIASMAVHIMDLSNAIDAVLALENSSDILLGHVAREPAPDVNHILPHATRVKVPQNLLNGQADVLHRASNG